MKIYLKIRDRMTNPNFIISLWRVLLPPEIEKMSSQPISIQIKKLPRKIRRILIINKNFVMKWSSESFVRQSYQVDFRPWKPHPFV